MVSILLGPGATFSAAKVEYSPIIFMDGPLAHAMDHKACCPDLEENRGDGDCGMAACTMTGCAFSFLPATPTASAVKVSLANTPDGPPSLTGLSRHNLPLPPP
jgi:hypothetical protein